MACWFCIMLYLIFMGVYRNGGGPWGKLTPPPPKNHGIASASQKRENSVPSVLPGGQCALVPSAAVLQNYEMLQENIYGHSQINTWPNWNNSWWHSTDGQILNFLWPKAVSPRVWSCWIGIQDTASNRLEFTGRKARLSTLLKRSIRIRRTLQNLKTSTLWQWHRPGGKVKSRNYHNRRRSQDAF